MAEQVTGRIGNEDVVLYNAASEATLEKLLEAVDKSAKKSDKEKTEQKAELKRFTEKLKDGTATLDDFSKAATSAAKSAASSVGRGFSNVGDAAFGLASEFATGSARLSDFSSHITGLINQIPLIGGLIGGPLQLFTGFIDNNVDTFRELSTVGVDFGNSIFAAQEAATRSRLSLDVFANAVGQNSKSLSLLAGNASRGAEIFRDLSNRVQRNFTSQFAQLGLTMEETAEFTGDFLDIQTRLGRAQQRDQRTLGRQTNDYIKQIDLLAKVTGAQREQISEELKQQALDKRIQGLLATLDDGARQTLQSTAAALEAQSPAVADAFKNMVATGGVPVTDFGRDLARLNPRLQQLTAGVRNGTVSQQEVFEEFRRTARIANQQGDQFIQFTGTLAALGSEVGSATLAMLGFENFAEGFDESQQQQIDAMEQGGKAFAAFESAIVQARNQVLGAFINSGVFESVSDILADFVEYMTDPTKGLGQVERAIDSFSLYFNNLFEKLGDPDYTMGDMIAELGEDALKKLTPLFAKLAEAGIKAIGIAIKEIFSNPVVATGTVLAISALFGLSKVVTGTIGAIVGLFTSRLVTNAMSTNIGKLFNRNRGPGTTAGPRAGPRAGPGIPKGLGLAGVTLSAAELAMILGDSDRSGGQKAADASGVAGGAGGAYFGAKAGLALGALTGPAAPIASPLLALGFGTAGYFAGRDVGQGLGNMAFGDNTNNNQMQNAAETQVTVTDAQLERLDNLVSFAPKIDNLKQSVGGFQNEFNSLDLNYREIDRTTRSLERMTDQLEEINTQLAGGEQGFFDRFTNNNETTAGDVLSGVTNSNQDQLRDLNRVMKDILGVLLSANDMERKHLTATRRLTGTLYGN